MRVVGIYQQGIKYATIESGWKRPLKIRVQGCYEGFKEYEIDGRYYWYYAQECVYQIEDSKTRKIVFVAIARNPQEVVDYFNEKVKGELELP